MLPFGYWSNSALSCDGGTLGSRTGTGDTVGSQVFDHFPQAPPQDCLETFQLAYRETKSMLKEQLETLMTKINADFLTTWQTNNNNVVCGLWTTPEADMLIFNISNALNLSDSVKYLACEIHKRFLANFNKEMLKAVVDLNSANIQQLETRTRELVILRIGSCIQLASKMNTAHVSHLDVSIADLNAIFDRLDCKFSTEAIQQSEMRVFDALDYNLNMATVLDVVESILIQLGLSVMEYRYLYSVAIYALDHLYLNRQGIQNAFYNITAATFGHNPNMNWNNMKPLQDAAIAEQHKFVEGCAVVFSGFGILRMETHPAYQVACQVAAARTDLRYVQNLSTAIIHPEANAVPITVDPFCPANNYTYEGLSTTSLPFVSPSSRNT